MNPKEAISFKDKNRMFVNSIFFDFLFMLPKVNNFDFINAINRRYSTVNC